MGRPRLPTPECRLRKKLSHEAWKAKNWDYYVEQKRLLSSRPAYKAARKARYVARTVLEVDESFVHLGNFAPSSDQ